MSLTIPIRTWWIVALLLTAISIGCGGEKPAPPKSDVSPVHSLSFSNDGKLLAAGRGTFGRGQPVGASEVVVWHTDTWNAPKVYKNDLTRRIAGVAFSDDGRTILAASDNILRGGVGDPWGGNRLDTWDVETGKPGKPLVLEKDWEQGDGAGSITQMAFDTRSGLIVLGRSGGWTYTVDRKTGVQKYKLRDASREFVALSADGKKLATVTITDRVVQPKQFDRVGRICAYEVQLRETQTGKLLVSLDIGGESSEFANVSNFRSLAYSSDGRLAVGCPSGKVFLISEDLKKIETTIQLKGGEPIPLVSWIAFSPEGSQLAAAIGKAVSIIDSKKASVIRTLDHPARVNALAYSPDNKLLAVGFGDEKNDGTVGPCGVKVWDAKTGELKKELK